MRLSFEDLMTYFSQCSIKYLDIENEAKQLSMEISLIIPEKGIK